MYYLGKVIAIMENGAYKDSMEKLDKTLRAQGIVMQCFWIEDLGLSEITPETVFDGVWAAHENVEVPESAATLWFTDMSDIVKVLSNLELPVLALLHEKNHSQDFSAALYACEEPEDLDGDYMDKVYRRYRRIPWEILRTRRCVLRESTPEDVERFWEIYKEPAITRYTDELYPTMEQEKQYMNEYIDKVYGLYGFGIWTVVRQEDGEIIGRAGLSYREGFEEPEIGFVIGLSWQGQGYAEEICRAILQYGREELEFNRVQAFVRPENEASLKLCQKLHMEPVEEVWLSGKKYVRLGVDFATGEYKEIILD